MSKKDKLNNKVAVSASSSIDLLDSRAEQEREAETVIERVTAIYGECWWDAHSHFNLEMFISKVAAEIREAVQAERQEIIAMLTDGSYCRYVDHAQDLCECGEIKKDILARNS